MKFIIIILLLLMNTLFSIAQVVGGCSVSGFGSKEGDNGMEVNLTSSLIQKDGKTYYVCEFRLKRLGDWYEGLVDPNEGIPEDDMDYDPDAYTYALTSMDAYFSLSHQKFVGTPTVTWHKINGNRTLQYFDPEAKCKLVDQSTSTTADVWFALAYSTSRTTTKLFGSQDYLHVVSIEWEVAAGASGEVGLTGRDNSVKLHGSSAVNGFNGLIGFCFSGNGIQSLGGGEKPVLADVSGDTKICQGVGKTYTTSFTAGADGATVKWTVKKEGVDVTANVVQGGAISSTTTSATFTWADDVLAGDYMISAIPTNGAGDGDEKLLAIHVYVPTVTITGNPEGCAGAPLALAAAPATMQSYQWYIKNGSTQTPVSGATNAAYTPNLPANGATITYKVEAVATAAEGGCTASAEKTITINPIPPLAVETEIAGGKRPINSTKYALGDKIVLTVLNGDKNSYNYSWLEGSHVGSGLEYIIPNATAETYNINLHVEPKSGGCGRDTTIVLTRDASLCSPTLLLAGTGGNKICTGGVCRLKAEVTNVCDNNSVLKYEWYQGNNLLASQTAPGEMIAYYTVKTAGTYTVRLYTLFGMVSKDVTITANTTLAETLTVPASTTIGSGETAILAAQCNNVTQWTWTPEDLINGSHEQQYVTTQPLTEDSDFTVYAEQTNGCVSSGETKVKIGTNGLHVELQPAQLALCKGGSGTLEAKVAGGTPPYQFTWPTTNLLGLAADNIAKYKHDGITTDYTEYLTVTDASGESKNVAVKVTIANAPEPSLELKGGDLCEGDMLTVVRKSGNVTNYTWYIQDNATNTITPKPNQGANLVMSDRGDYTVWVAGNTSVCASDTARTKASVKVNGFDLAWDPEPADYKLGSEINAGVRVDNSTSTTFTFDWDALANGQQITAAGVNPSKYRVTTASENSYHFKVQVGVKISDTKTCPKTLDKQVATQAGGLLLTVADKTVTQCTGGAVQISASAQGGTGAYTFTWYKAGETTELRRQVYPVGGAATDVFVHGGFSDGDKVVVQVADASSPALTRRDTIVVNTSSANAPIVDAGADMTIKSGTTTVLFGSVPNGTAKSWHWSPDNWLASGESTKQYPTTKTLTGQQDYTLYVIGDNGCVSQPDGVTVNVTTTDGFTVDIEEPGVLCWGNTTQLSATTTPGKIGISWEWHETTGQLTNPNAEHPDFDATETTTVYVKATVGSITATNSKVITVKDNKAPVLDIQGFLADGSSVCEASELKVVDTNTPAVVLAEATWYVEGVEKQKGSTLTYKPQLADNTPAYQKIKVEAKSNAGCSCVAFVEKDVMIYPQPELEWDASSSGALALGDTPIQVKANLKAETQGDYTYSWTHTDTKGTFTYEDGGKIASAATSATSKVNGLTNGAQVGDLYCFGVQVTDGKGCKSEAIHRDAMVDGDALIIELAPKYADGYCAGGAAILVATVKAVAQPSGLKYEWYKNETLITASDAGYSLNGNELLVKAPLESDVYKVKVTADDGKAGQSTGVNLTKNAAYSAITLTGVDLMIPAGTRTALMAEPSASIKAWQWGPVDKLAADESTLQNPYTVNLTAAQDYTVYGVDEHHCVTQPAVVKVGVVGKTAPDGADPELFASIDPASRIICATNRLQLQTKVWGNVGGTMTYSWNPTDLLDMTPGDDKPIFSTDQPGNYSYAVTIGNGTLKAIARTDIEVKTGMLPEITLDESKTGMACAGSEVVVKVTNGVAVDKYTWIINGVVNTQVTGNTYTWPSVDNPTEVHVKVIAETAGHCMSKDLIEMDSLVKPALKLDDLQVVDSCGQVILFSNAGKEAQYTWSLTAGETQLQKEVGASSDTLYLKQITAFTSASVPYTVALKVKPKDGGCESTGTKSGKVYFQPKVALDKWNYEGEALSYTVREKGVNVPVSIDNDHSNFGVGNSTLDWMSYKGVTLITSQEQAIEENIQQEDTIVAIVTNKEAPGCVSRDSMPVYLYPDAPEVDIDTNTNRNNIKLTWKSIPADSIRVWGIVDDALNVLGNDYKRLASVKAINKEWIEPNMGDRLKFYYLQSVRKIGNKSFASQVVSDTVGWLKQTLYGKNTTHPSLSGKNLIAYPFDMSTKGIRTNRDFMTKIVAPVLMNGGASIGYWDFTAQKWINNDYYDVMGDGSFFDWAGIEFDLVKGSVYLVIFAGPQINSADLLLYGKLASWSYDFRVNKNKKSSKSLVLNPLATIDKQKRQTLGMAIPATDVGVWEFPNQKYNNANYYEFMPGWWEWTPDEASDTLLLQPLQPLLIIVDTEILNWKK